MDALQSEGLDLDLVDQMKDLAVVSDDDRESKTNILDSFERSAPSTKVCCCCRRFFVLAAAASVSQNRSSTSDFAYYDF